MIRQPSSINPMFIEERSKIDAKQRESRLGT